MADPHPRALCLRKCFKLVGVPGVCAASRPRSTRSSGDTTWTSKIPRTGRRTPAASSPPTMPSGEPTAAIPMANPYCSCKPTRGRPRCRDEFSNTVRTNQWRESLRVRPLPPRFCCCPPLHIGGSLFSLVCFPIHLLPRVFFASAAAACKRRWPSNAAAPPRWPGAAAAAPPCAPPRCPLLLGVALFPRWCSITTRSALQ